MSWGPFFRGFVEVDEVLDSGLGEAEADVEVLGSDFMVREPERPAFRGAWSWLSISTSSGDLGDGRTARGLGGLPLTWSDTTSGGFTLDGDDLDRGSSKVRDEVEASDEG